MTKTSAEYLADEEIAKILDELDQYAYALAAARTQGDYAGVCFYVGCLRGLADRLRNRNVQIEKEGVT